MSAQLRFSAFVCHSLHSVGDSVVHLMYAVVGMLVLLVCMFCGMMHVCTAAIYHEQARQIENTVSSKATLLGFVSMVTKTSG